MKANIIRLTVITLSLWNHNAWARLDTPLEKAGNTPTWEENFPFGKIQNVQAYVAFEHGSTDQMNVFTAPGVIYLGHKNSPWSEVQFNHVYHLPGEVWAGTIEYDVLSLELNSGERTHFIRPIRGSSDAKVFLYLAGASNETRAFCIDDVNRWRLDKYDVLTGPPYGWTHVVCSYKWDNGHAHYTLAINHEIHEWVATIADPKRAHKWQDETNWSWEWSSEDRHGNNLGKYFANIRAFPAHLTKTQVQSALDSHLDRHLAMMNALPAPPTSGTMFTQIGKRYRSEINGGGVPSYAMIYAEQTGPKTMLLDGSWSMGWGAMTFDWDFGDGTTGTGRKVSHTYASEGNYTVTLKVDCPVWYGSGHEKDSNTKNITVRDMPLIMVTSPNGGEDWAANSQHNVTWSADASVGNVVVEYSTDWGWTWNQIASGVRASAGQCPWKLPNIHSSQVRVRVRTASNDPSDLSDADFTISSGIPVSK